MTRSPTALWLVLTLVIGTLVGIGLQRAVTPPTVVRAPEVREVYARVQHSVVDLRVVSPTERHGAGVVTGPHEVMTARHLVLDTTAPIEVHTADGRILSATVRGTDARTDLALLTLSEPLPPAHMAEARSVRVGDTVLAVGNPFGLQHSLSVGAVGATGRRLSGGNGPADGFLQLSIPLNPGNSGGPIFDLQGRMVGLLTGTHTEGQAIAFAVPSEVVAESMPALRSGEAVSRAFMGIRLSDGPEGVKVVSIIPTGPADLAGLRPGDLLTNFDGVDVGQAQTLYDRLDSRVGGDVVPVRLLREGSLKIADVELADWAEQPVVIAGMTLRPAPGSGGRVVAVRPRSRASRAGVEIEDVVHTIDGLPVQAPADVRAALSSSTAAQIGIDRQGRGLQLSL